MRTLLLLSLTPALLCGQSHLGKTPPQWEAQLSSDNRVERLVAARSLGEMALAGNADAAKATFAALEHADSAVRYWAAVTAGEMGAAAKPAQAALAERLEDTAPEVQVWAAYALVKLGRSDLGLQTLIDQLGNPEEGARLQAITALDQLGEAAAPAAPDIEAATRDEFDYVQRIARHSLWVLGQRPCPYQECP